MDRGRYILEVGGGTGGGIIMGTISISSCTQSITFGGSKKQGRCET